MHVYTRIMGLSMTFPSIIGLSSDWPVYMREGACPCQKRGWKTDQGNAVPAGVTIQEPAPLYKGARNVPESLEEHLATAELA